MMRSCALLLLVMPLFAAAATKVDIALEDADNRPFEYRDDLGRLTGFHIELIRAAAQRLDWDVTFLAVPWTRAEAMLADGRVNAVSYMAAAEKRKGYAMFLPGNQLHLQQIGLFGMAERIKRMAMPAALPDIARQYRVGAAKNYFYGTEINTLIDKDNVIDHHAQNITQLMQMMAAGRYDLALATAGALQQLAHENAKLATQIRRLPGIAFEQTPIYLAFSNKGSSPKLAADFARAYAELRQGAYYRQLVAKYQVADMLPDFR